MLTKIENVILYMIAVTMPIMSVIDYFGIFTMNTSLSDVLIIIFCILTIIKLKTYGLKRVLPYLWYFIGMVIIIILSNLYAYCCGAKIVGVIGIVSEIIKVGISATYFYVAFNTLTDKDNGYMKKLLHFWLFGTWIVIICGLVIQINYYLHNIININKIITLDRGRFLGTITDANIAATFMGISFVISLILYQIETIKKLKIYYFITLIFSFLCVILTMSRGGIISFILAIIYIAIYQINKRKISISTVILLLLVMANIICLAIDFDYTFLSGKTSNIFFQRIYDVINKKGQYGVRTNLANVAIEMGKDYFFMGVGKGNFVINSEKYFIKVARNNVNPLYNYGIIPHNTLLGYFSETGIIGLIWFLLIFTIYIKYLVKKKDWFNMIFFSIFLQIAIHSLSINIENFRGLWYLLGIAFAYNINDNRLSPQHNPEPNNKKAMRLIFLLLFIFGVLILDTFKKV